MKNKNLLLLSACLSIGALSVGLTGCDTNKGSNTPDNPLKPIQNKRGKIIFDSHGGDKCPSIDVEKNETLKFPVTSKKNSIFKGWFYDEKYTNIANENDFIYLEPAKDVVLHAKWENVDFNKDGRFKCNLNVEITDIIEHDVNDLPSGYLRVNFNNDLIKEGRISRLDGKRYLDIVIGGSSKFGYFQGGNKYKAVYKDEKVSEKSKKAYMYNCNYAGKEGHRSIRFEIEEGQKEVEFDIQEKMLPAFKNKDDFMKAAIDLSAYHVKLFISDITYDAYIEKNDILEDGLYSVETHSAKTKNGFLSMGETFNNSKTYIEVKNGKTRMYKTFQSYFGLTSYGDSIEGYFSMMPLFTNNVFCTPVTNAYNEKYEYNDNLDGNEKTPWTQKYQRGKIVPITSYYDADKALLTFSWPVSNWRDSYVITGTVTGFMLEFRGMASSELLLAVDQRTIAKCNDKVDLPSIPDEPASLEFTNIIYGNDSYPEKQTQRSLATNFVWEADSYDSEISDKKILSWSSVSSPYYEDGELKSNVKYKVYGADKSKQQFQNIVAVDLKYGAGHGMHTGDKTTVKIIDDKLKNELNNKKLVSISVDNIEECPELSGKKFDDKYELHTNITLDKDSLVIPNIVVDVDGFKFSTFKRNQNDPNNPLVASENSYKFYVSRDGENWFIQPGICNSNKEYVEFEIGKDSLLDYKYIKASSLIIDQYGETIDASVIYEIDASEVNKWTLDESCKLNYDVNTYGEYKEVSAGDEIILPILKADGENIKPQISRYDSKATPKDDDKEITPVNVSSEDTSKCYKVSLNDADYMMKIEYKGKYSSQIFYISNKDHIRLNFKTPREVKRDGKLYIEKPFIFIDGEQLFANIMYIYSNKAKGLDLGPERDFRNIIEIEKPFLTAIESLIRLNKIPDENNYLYFSIKLGPKVGDGAYVPGWSSFSFDYINAVKII